MTSNKLYLAAGHLFECVLVCVRRWIKKDWLLVHWSFSIQYIYVFFVSFFWFLLEMEPVWLAFKAHTHTHSAQCHVPWFLGEAWLVTWGVVAKRQVRICNEWPPSFVKCWFCWQSVMHFYLFIFLSPWKHDLFLCDPTSALLFMSMSELELCMDCCISARWCAETWRRFVEMTFGYNLNNSCCHACVWLILDPSRGSGQQT